MTLTIDQPFKHLTLNIAKFLISTCLIFIWPCNPSIVYTVHYRFWGYEKENLKLAGVSVHSLRSDCAQLIQAGLALYCWQRLKTRQVLARCQGLKINVNCKISLFFKLPLQCTIIINKIYLTTKVRQTIPKIFQKSFFPYYFYSNFHPRTMNKNIFQGLLFIHLSFCYSFVL